jgi:serine/threonine protein kinase
MLDILQMLYKLGIINRDIKLNNLLIDDNEFIKLIDFDISLILNVEKISKYANIKYVK